MQNRNRAHSESSLVGVLSVTACLQQLLTPWHNKRVLIGLAMARVIDEGISQAWLDAAKDLGIRVTAPFTLESSEPTTYEAHVVDFGGPKGTVVGVLNDNLDDDNDDRAVQGFYRSNLAPSYRHYERHHFIDTLNDWGWYGPEGLRPAWYTGKSWS